MMQYIKGQVPESKSVANLDKLRSIGFRTIDLPIYCLSLFDLTQSSFSSSQAQNWCQGFPCCNFHLVKRE